jgi:polysaccharide biosynthesis/export protein
MLQLREMTVERSGDKCFLTRRRGLFGHLFAVCAVTLLLSACAPGRNLPPLPEQKSDIYRLGPGDVVRLITFGDQQLTAEFKVSDSGNIAVPLLGNVHAAGLSAEQLKAKVESEMVAKKLYRDPSVAVEIISYRPIFVLGEVTRPGQYPYQPGMTVLTAVAVAGGFTYRAVDDSFSVVRRINGEPVEGLVSRQSLMEPGDVLSVFERHF